MAAGCSSEANMSTQQKGALMNVFFDVMPQPQQLKQKICMKRMFWSRREEFDERAVLGRSFVAVLLR